MLRLLACIFALTQATTCAEQKKELTKNYRRLFDAMNSNNDDQVTFEEYFAYMKEQMSSKSGMEKQLEQLEPNIRKLFKTQVGADVVTKAYFKARVANAC